MAKKKVAAVVKIQIPAGAATPAPPVGTALGPHGVAIMDFCKDYNAATEAQRGSIIPVEITIYEDRSFTFILKTPPTSTCCIKQAAGLDKGATATGRETAGSITAAQVAEIAQIKMPDLNANDLEAATLQVAGTARSMGITVDLIPRRWGSQPDPSTQKRWGSASVGPRSSRVHRKYLVQARSPRSVGPARC